jgi:hypothetical protein
MSSIPPPTWQQKNQKKLNSPLDLIHLVVVLNFNVFLVNKLFYVTLDIFRENILKSTNKNVTALFTNGIAFWDEFTSSNSPREVKYLPTYILPMVL